MLDLHRLRILRELKHRCTLAAVAKALSYSPSAISQQLTQLAAEVGVPLLEPVGRRVRLTAQAEILVAHTEVLLERLEQAEADIARSMVEITGTLRIASFQTALLALLPTVLTLLRDAHPRLRVEITQLEPEIALPALLSGDFDVVLAEEYPGHVGPRPAGLEYEDLCADPMQLAQPRGRGAPSPAEDLAALADRPWVMEPAGSPAHRWATTLCRTAGFEPDVRFESTDLLVHLRLVEQGHAVALLPGLVWFDRKPTVHLRTVQSRALFTAVRRGSSRHPAIEACRHALRQAVLTPQLKEGKHNQTQMKRR